MSTNGQPGARLEFVDAQRGLAVLLMLWMHTADGWLQPGLKQGPGWGWIRSIGGLAAPTFLMLAGVSLALGWSAASQVGRARVELARATQLVVLGYLLRVQMWMLDAGGYHHAKCWAAALPLAGGYLLAYRALGRFPRDPSRARRLALPSLACTTLGLAIVSYTIPGRFLQLLRVDVLQAIGASLLILCALRRPLQRWPAAGALLALGAAFATAWFRAWVPGPLPVPIAGYLAAWDTPPNQLAPTLFPLFPWLAYACAGTTVGLRLGRAELARPGSGRQWALWLAAAGALSALASCEALHPAHALIASVPVLTQPVRVAYRLGIGLALGGLAVGLSLPRAPFRRGLLALGQASLAVYWVHLELSFGSVARPLLHRLSYGEWAAGFVAMSVLMAALARVWLKARRAGKPPARAASNTADPVSLSRA